MLKTYLRELGPQRPRVPVTYMEQTHQTEKMKIQNFDFLLYFFRTIIVKYVYF